jgi:hypothetical protein
MFELSSFELIPRVDLSSYHFDLTFIDLDIREYPSLGFGVFGVLGLGFWVCWVRHFTMGINITSKDMAASKALVKVPMEKLESKIKSREDMYFVLQQSCK